MKKTIYVLLLCLALLLIATPLLADRPAPVGERINVLSGTPDTYPAVEPFHVGHGWLLNPEDTPKGQFVFQLDIDGVYQESDYFFVQMDEGQMTRFWLFNYPAGMTGVHTFNGHWFAPCQFAVDNGYIPGPCARPNMPVEALTHSLTVTFTP